MKKMMAILLALCLAFSGVCAASAASLTGTENSWLMVTEVAAYPGANTEEDIGQLIEVYNNTDAELDLYGYELVFNTSRSTNLSVALGDDKLLGGFYLANEAGKSILKPGELAVLWVVHEEAQKSFTEADVRRVAAAGEGAAAIPEGTQIFRIDTTDTATAFGNAPYVRRDGVCYAMVNKRDGHVTKSADDCGAFARVYGQIGQGRSQLYGDIGSQSAPKWQADLTATAPESKTSPEVDANVPLNFGTLAEVQKDVFATVYIPPKPVFSLTGTENSWLMVTEVAACPSTEMDFGQLIEVYNNTSADLDLYDYEIAITISRDTNLEVALGQEKLRGGFYLANEPGKYILKSGELAVLRIVFDEAQKGYTEQAVRQIAASGEEAVVIPAGTQIFVVDTTDTTTAFSAAPYVRRDGVCYAMVNKRDGHVTKAADDCGAFARVYGQIGQGRSQLYGDIAEPNRAPKWQVDITPTTPGNDSTPLVDANVAMSFGTLFGIQDRTFETVFVPDEPKIPDTPDESITQL